MFMCSLPTYSLDYCFFKNFFIAGLEKPLFHVPYSITFFSKIEKKNIMTFLRQDY